MTEPETRPKLYVSPELHVLGDVRTLTQVIPEKCSGSADAILPRDVTQLDNSCVIP